MGSKSRPAHGGRLREDQLRLQGFLVGNVFEKLVHDHVFVAGAYRHNILDFDEGINIQLLEPDTYPVSCMTGDDAVYADVFLFLDRKSVV